MSSFFGSKKPIIPTDGVAPIRISFCGNVKSGAGFRSGWSSVTLKTPPFANNKAEAINIVTQKLNNVTGDLTDAAGKKINMGAGYSIGSASYTESKTTPGKFYHDIRLINPEDRFCNQGGRKRKTKKAKRSRKSRRSTRSRR